MNATLKTIYSLHSTHGNFSSREIAASDLETILKAGIRAANASARQSYSIIVVDDRTVMKEYLEYAGSKALIFCADFTRLKDTAEYLGHPFECGGIEDFITACTDTALAAQTSAIAAASLGIGYLFTNSVRRGNLESFYKKFNLPDKYCFPLVALILGYPENSDTAVRGRLDGLGIVHNRKYSRLGGEELETLVQEYDRADKNMGLVFFKRGAQGHSRYLDWFYRVWCKPGSELQKRRRVEIADLLKKIGYIE
ncbi:MAG TPA: nitroreductase [Clostridia bacterium]|nr:nitroreductase [Clostridia bacterium]